jgi:hypothetical protein
MSKCLDCGCTLEGGICSNCHEELFISTYQSEDMIFPSSSEFMQAAAEQSKEIENRDRLIREDPQAFHDLESTDNYYKR